MLTSLQHPPCAGNAPNVLSVSLHSRPRGKQGDAHCAAGETETFGHTSKPPSGEARTGTQVSPGCLLCTHSLSKPWGVIGVSKDSLEEEAICPGNFRRGLGGAVEEGADKAGVSWCGSILICRVVLMMARGLIAHSFLSPAPSSGRGVA